MEIKKIQLLYTTKFLFEKKGVFCTPGWSKLTFVANGFTLLVNNFVLLLTILPW